MSLGRIGAGGIACLLLAACSKADDSGETVFNLPTELTEVSGLAVAGPDSVFTHDDEFAIVYEIRLRDGKVLRAFAFGEPTLEGDFEGIAAAAGHVYLVTSDGLIYLAEPGVHGERVTFYVYDSGIGPRCEVEGLSLSPAPGELLLLCKRFRNDDDEARLEIHRWKTGSYRAEPEPFLSLPLAGLLGEAEQVDFRPSSIEWDPRTRQMYVVSARNRMLVVLDAEGAPVETRRLDSSRHPNVEGIALMPDGRLVLADEGSETREGRLTVYEMVPDPASRNPT
ncbi:MAG TPA: SdiA-regulated domain-containing protein [Sphingomonadaceae bacterium]|nr:SdiA-regulated domain-containing protein [Sphingomonadaceae bacterium]